MTKRIISRDLSSFLFDRLQNEHKWSIVQEMRECPHDHYVNDDKYCRECGAKTIKVFKYDAVDEMYYAIINYRKEHGKLDPAKMADSIVEDLECNCGWDINQNERTCSNGHKNNHYQKYCTECGTKLGEDYEQKGTEIIKTLIEEYLSKKK